MNKILERDAGSPGRELVASATKELNDKLALGIKKGWSPDYVREVRDVGIQDIERKYSELVNNQVARLENEVGEYEKIYKSKFENSLPEMSFKLKRAEVRINAMTNDDLKKLVIAEVAGRSGIFEPAEKELLAHAVRSRLGEADFETLRTAHKAQEYDKPWLKLASGVVADLKTLRERPRGYYMSQQTSEKNGNKAWFGVRIDELVDNPVLRKSH